MKGPRLQLLCVALAACTSACTLNWDRPSPDASAQADGPDGGQREGGPDPREGGTPAGDNGPAKPDTALAPDRGPDGPAGKLDLPVPPAPCSSKAAAKGGYALNMVVCIGTTALNQCAAKSLCNLSGGWKLCSANQFVARGGAATYVSPPAWVGSCIRSAGVPHVPSQGPCACINNGATTIYIAWPCGSGPAGNTSSSEVGVRTSGSCRSLGIKGSVNANWRNWGSTKTIAAAVCCR